VLAFAFLLGFLLVSVQSVFQIKAKQIMCLNYVIVSPHVCGLGTCVLCDLHGIRSGQHGLKAYFVSLEITNLEP
jgi:hypothetical protein